MYDILLVQGHELERAKIQTPFQMVKYSFNIGHIFCLYCYLCKTLPCLDLVYWLNPPPSNISGFLTCNALFLPVNKVDRQQWRI